ncbi:hypothetical protein FY049_00075 [Acinetobacter sp. 1125_18A]
MKRMIGMGVLTFCLSSLSYADQTYGLRSAETIAYLINLQAGQRDQSICTYRSETKMFGVHDLQMSIQNGCPQNLGYTATTAGGGILRIFGNGNSIFVKRLGYRPPVQSSSPVVSKYKRLCDNPNMSVSFNQKTGETTDCRTGEVSIDPQIKVLKEQGLWPHK